PSLARCDGDAAGSIHCRFGALAVAQAHTGARACHPATGPTVVGPSRPSEASRRFRAAATERADGPRRSSRSRRRLRPEAVLGLRRADVADEAAERLVLAQIAEVRVERHAVAAEQPIELLADLGLAARVL